MATLKDHQQAMVDLLASGSGIPASASRLAHAMHDVIGYMVGGGFILDSKTYVIGEVDDATTPGLNDKALACDIEAVRHKGKPAYQRIKELENTVKQLRVSNQKLRGERDMLHGRLLAHEHPTEPAQAGCRKDDTQVCGHIWVTDPDNELNFCAKCGWQKQ